MASNLKKTIMRRVYYSYALSFLSESMLWQGLMLGACIALFGRLTHVAAIAHNLGATSISNAPSYIWNSVAHAFVSGEVFTVLVVVAIAILGAKFCVQAFSLFGKLPKMQVV